MDRELGAERRGEGARARRVHDAVGGRHHHARRAADGGQAGGEIEALDRREQAVEAGEPGEWERPDVTAPPRASAAASTVRWPSE